MADRHPIVIHHDDEQLHELVVGDNLDLDGSGVVNATSVALKNGTADQILMGDGSTTSLAGLPDELNDLTDVNAPTPVADSHLEWNGTAWVPVLRSKIVNMLDMDSTNSTDGAVLTRSFTDDGFEMTNLELDGLFDVDTTGEANGDVLTYNSTSGNWEATAPSSSVSVLSDLTDVSSNAPNNGQILSYNGSVWLPVAPNIMGNYDFEHLQTVGAAQDGYVLTYDNTTGFISLAEPSGAGGIGQSATEGTWTPVLQHTGGNYGSVTYNTATFGTWTRLGNRVFVTARLKTDAVTIGSVGASQRACVGGFPFSIDGSIVPQTMINGRTTGFTTTVTGLRSWATLSDRFVFSDNTSKQDEVAYNQITSLVDIAFSGHYVTDAT